MGLHSNPAKHSTHMLPPHACTLTVKLINWAELMTSFTVSVRKRTSPVVRFKSSAIDMLLRASIWSVTFAYVYMYMCVAESISYIQSKIATGVLGSCMCIAATCRLPLTAVHRFPTMMERSQSIVSGSSHSPLVPHILKARLDCDCSHGHGWIAVCPAGVEGHVILSRVSCGQKAPVAEGYGVWLVGWKHYSVRRTLSGCCIALWQIGRVWNCVVEKDAAGLELNYQWLHA